MFSKKYEENFLRVLIMGDQSKQGHGFGTSPVFLAAVCTILGAILFLRFGYSVGHTGLHGAMLIVLIGHAITIPTAMAISEISTNLKVEGGGEYFIISRSYGQLVGGTIGISLYLSQAISVAFYMIAFSEAFTPYFDKIEEFAGFTPDIRMISIPATLLLLAVIIYKGANLGVAALWVVFFILGTSLFMFFLGSTGEQKQFYELFTKVENADDFFRVFAIMFPAFTGMTAGVGLSGDLKNPRKSIPLGTMSATITGMIIYLIIAFKLATNLSPEILAEDQFAMSRIAVWGPIIPIGLAAATLSSAIGSILIAPRTLQALSKDRIFPFIKMNNFLQKGRVNTNEPVNATLMTSLIVMLFVSMGSVDLVAQIISMFFMITYGALCLVSFLEHFSGDPSYRPTFKTKWYLSLIGATACIVMMFLMAPVYAAISILTVVLIYYGLKKERDNEQDISTMLKGVLFQLTRKLQILIQKKTQNESQLNWRPSVIAITPTSLDNLAPFDLLRWICYHYGFGTYIHYIEGPLSAETLNETRNKKNQLIALSLASESALYVDTIISPSFKTAVAQIIQIPGISGMENNSVLFQYDKNNPECLAQIIDACNFAEIVDYNIFICRSSERHFGYRKKIHIWLTLKDFRNANLMILLSFIITGHPEWRNSEIDIYAAFENKKMDAEVKKLNELIDKGRIPVSTKNVKKVPWASEKETFETIVDNYSENADLVILGFGVSKLKKDGGDYLTMFKKIKDILFVRAGQKIIISDE